MQIIAPIKRLINASVRKMSSHNSIKSNGEKDSDQRKEEEYDYKSFKQIKGIILKRVIKDYAHEVMGTGIEVEFLEGEKSEHDSIATKKKDVQQFLKDHKVHQRLFEAICLAMSNDKGAVVYFSDNMDVENEIRKIDSINVFSGEHVIVEHAPDDDVFKNWFMDVLVYSDVGVKEEVEQKEKTKLDKETKDGQKIRGDKKLIHPSRVSIIDFSFGGASYAKTYAPHCHAIEEAFGAQSIAVRLATLMFYFVNKKTYDDAANDPEAKKNLRDAVQALLDNAYEKGIFVMHQDDKLSLIHI